MPKMLKTWADNLPDRRVIIEFWDWVLNKAHSADPASTNPPEISGATMIEDVNIEKLLDQYHHINQRQLDKERREILDQHTKLNEQHELL